MAINKVTSDRRKEIGIGLLGCGFMGKCHTNAYKKMPYIYTAANLMPRLGILCDKNEEIVEREAARYGYEAYCTDWHDLVADERVDVGPTVEQGFLLTFGQAARHDHASRLAPALQLQHLVDRGIRLPTRLLDETARVNDDHIGLGNVFLDLIVSRDHKLSH